MKLTKLMTFMSGIFALALIGLFTFESMSQIRQQHTATAFTARYSETSTDTATERTAQRQHLYWAVRSDGSISAGSLDERYGQRSVLDYSKKLDVTLSDPLKLKTTRDYSYLDVPRKNTPKSPDCRPEGSVVSLGTDTIGSYKVYGFQKVNAQPGGAREEADQWLAPELDCWNIRYVVRRFDGNGHLTGLFERKTSAIVEGEPEEKLFEIPEGYSETKPSEMEKAVILQMVTDREGVSGASEHVIPSHLQFMWSEQDAHYDAVTNRDWHPGLQ
jgi:hypothetical protein